MSKWLLSASELETLQHCLDALPEELDLTLPTLHGLMTGIAVLPIEVTSAVWSALLFHDTSPLAPADQERLFAILSQWRERLDRILQSGEAFELPVDLSYTMTEENEANAPSSDIPEVEEWCIGFIEAMVSCEQFEPSLSEHAEEITELSIPAAFVAGALEGTEWDELYERDEVVVDLLSALPDMVSDLYIALRVPAAEGSDETD